MIGGNLVALQQKNMKRMLAYSSIAHAGYLLVTVIVANTLGASAFLFYLVAYTLATMGAFAVVIALGEPGERNQEIADYAGLWYVSPWLASAMAVFMLALLGFPIAGGMGFFAKWYVIKAALQCSTSADRARGHPRNRERHLRGLLPRCRAGHVHEAEGAQCGGGAPCANRHLPGDLSLRLHPAAVRRAAQRIRDAGEKQRPDQHGECTGGSSGDNRGQSMTTRGRPRGLASFRGTG